MAPIREAPGALLILAHPGALFIFLSILGTPPLVAHTIQFRVPFVFATFALASPLTALAIEAIHKHSNV